MNILTSFETGSEKLSKQFAVLLDPDSYPPSKLGRMLDACNRGGADLILVGGSLLLHTRVDDFVAAVKAGTGLPVILFPGSPGQISRHADAILLLSLISGRNPDLLIGRHVEAAPLLRDSGLEVIPTGYMLIGSGNTTTAQYISNSFPIPGDKNGIAACTALAGQMLGMKLIYLDAGSGAREHVSAAMVSEVKAQLRIPLAVGGGIRSVETASGLATAGADIIVAGNALEEDPGLIAAMAGAVHAAASPDA
ncbi:MAG TPA: geranylgeranylglyceryl/heptaprenylglyceryl phosphate synthase [Bacteroidales bacterium]|nr:geranylgeranylglyceryl/heptaprenylglyceryl phosphate synthase [Bacteroidales bacterium]HSA44574.1 geranylgeranylglyceryl/heptaprenylglyceryl phosphate synthase [Bacteroidales bacterium]